MLMLGRRRLHTIISRELIKPSSPTPINLQTYNLSQLDVLNPTSYSPMVLFYPSNNSSSLTSNQKATLLKKSLSHSLTHYYPFAGRLHTPTTPSFVDCNDEGVLFIEAENDSKLDMYQHMSGQDENLNKLFPDGMVFYNSPHTTRLVAIQVTHFSCGGVAIAISLSHLIGDGCSLITFLSHWAYAALDGDHKLILKPRFMNFPRVASHIQNDQVKVNKKTKVLNNLVSRNFVFPNSKLSELKDKVAFNVTNPTRFEVLTSLIYKTAVEAASVKSGCFKPSYLFFMVNLRSKFVPKLPPTTIGNFVRAAMVRTAHTSETSLSTLVAMMKKEKLLLEGIQSVQEVAESIKSSRGYDQDLENFEKGSIRSSSFCGFAFNKLDFGWGRPTGTTLALRKADKNGFLLMDTADGEAIEALVMLDEECMEIFENDKKMLSYCQTS